MSKSKKLTNRIIAVILIVLGLILGGTWNSAKYCIGDKIFIALGISPWSNGSSGTHYPAIIGSFVILAGISILNLTLQKKTRLWIWTAVILCFIFYLYVVDDNFQFEVTFPPKSGSFRVRSTEQSAGIKIVGF